MKMGTCWMFMLLVGCRLSHATECQSTCTYNGIRDRALPCGCEISSRLSPVKVEPACVPAGATVHVPCPRPDAEEIKFNLFRDHELVYNHTCNLRRDSPNCTSAWTHTGVELQENRENKSVSFMLTGVNASTHGIYRCDAISIFPPPLKTVEHCLWILVLVQGHQCNGPCAADDAAPKFGSWIWIIIIVLVSIYSIAITIVAIRNWLKLRRADSQSDYMNTKPKPLRDRRKKRGVQNPIPRHF